MQPITPTAAAPECDPSLHAQVETWLSYLSSQEQTAVRLHYGLSDGDERAYSIAEMARLLAVKPVTVRARLRTALTRLKALAEGTATISEKQGQLRVTHISQFKPPTLTPEQERTLLEVATRLRAAGVLLSAARLSQASGLSHGRAQVFLRTHREQFPVDAARRTLHQQRLARVATVYAEHVAQGRPITSYEQLAQLAHVRKETAREFLHAERNKSHATC